MKFFTWEIDTSNLASENHVTKLSKLQMLAQKNLLPLASISLGSASQNILVFNANDEISVAWAQNGCRFEFLAKQLFSRRFDAGSSRAEL